MNPRQRRQILQDLASGIARRRLVTPACIILDVVEPLGFLASQIALFARPFTPLGRWREYVTALEDEEGWNLLHSLVDDRDS